MLQFRLFQKPENAFPLSHLQYIRNKLAFRIERTSEHNNQLWHGFRLLAVDKTTLTLPDSKELWKKFGSHKNCHGENSLAAEMCTLFSITTQIPIKYVIAKSYTAELTLLKKLMRYLKKGDLLLFDNGFYKFEIFSALKQKCCQFIIPAVSTHRPKLLQKINKDDYIAEIRSSATKKIMKVRVVYAYRKGFRRRRLISSLLDSDKYPAREIIELYHHRWMIETFFREFKSGMESIKWHCRTVHSFKIELCSHMISITLIKMIMHESAKDLDKNIWEISFSKSLIEVRLFFKRLFRNGTKAFKKIFKEVIDQCSKYLVDIRPGRSFSRNKHEYRSASRGKKKTGKKAKNKAD